MPFSGADVAFATLHGYRMAWIPGAYGNGKSLLAMGIYALYFRPRGYQLVTNMDTIWNVGQDLDSYKLDADGKLKAFVVIDEGGPWFEEGEDLKDILRNPRKMDYVLAIPSFWPPHRRAQIYQIQPTWSFRSAGIPLINYDWTVKIGTYKAKGSFKWAFFQDLFGTYSSLNPACSPAKIRKWLMERNKDFRKMYGYDDEDAVLDGGGDDLDTGGVGPADKPINQPVPGWHAGASLSFGGGSKSAAVRHARELEGLISLAEEATDDLEAVAARGAKRGKRG